MWMIALVSVAWLAVPAVKDATGRIIAEDATPVSGAQVCEITKGAAERCVRTDVQGVYRVVNTTHPTLLVRAKGFVATTIDAAPLTEPVKLRRAAVLLVTVIDGDTGKPLPEGRVMIDTPSGRRIGDFVPFNSSGVRISTLEPGLVFVRSQSGGYAPGGPMAVELVGGSERAVTVTMKKSRRAPR